MEDLAIVKIHLREHVFKTEDAVGRPTVTLDVVAGVRYELSVDLVIRRFAGRTEFSFLAFDRVRARRVPAWPFPFSGWHLVIVFITNVIRAEAARFVIDILADMVDDMLAFSGRLATFHVNGIFGIL